MIGKKFVGVAEGMGSLVVPLVVGNAATTVSKLRTDAFDDSTDSAVAAEVVPALLVVEETAAEEVVLVREVELFFEVVDVAASALPIHAASSASSKSARLLHRAMAADGQAPRSALKLEAAYVAATSSALNVSNNHGKLHRE